MIKYYLIENPLVEGKFYARVQTANTYDEDALIKYMMTKNSGQSEADIRAVLTLRKSCIVELVGNSNRVNEDLSHFVADIKGAFNDPNDSFDSSRHQIKAESHTSVLFTRNIKNTPVAKVVDVADKTNPVTGKFMDHGSDTQNELLTPGSIGVLKGRRLKYNAAAEDEGVFLLNESGEETKIILIVKNNPSELIFGIPVGLADGTYTLEVRNRYNESKALKTNQLKYSLEVLPPATEQ